MFNPKSTIRAVVHNRHIIFQTSLIFFWFCIEVLPVFNILSKINRHAIAIMKTAIVMNNTISIIVNFCVKHLFVQISKFNTIKGWNITGILLEIYCVSQSAIFKRKQKIKELLGFKADKKTLDAIFEGM